MAARHRICAQCGSQFCYEIKRGSDRKYCSDRCASFASKLRRIEKVKELSVCAVDGCCDVAVRVGAGLCEKHYMRLRRNGSTDALVDVAHYERCQYCGAHTGGNKHCSSRCATRASRGTPRFKVCVECGKEFEPLNKGIDKNTCSVSCESKKIRKLRREYYANQMASNPGFVLRVRSAEYKRKSRKRNAFVEDVDRDFVMKRDKWICHLCGEKIPASAKWPSGLFGTLDHVIPLAAGGLHSYANVKAAHLSCNCSKRDRSKGQLGLEFAA